MNFQSQRPLPDFVLFRDSVRGSTVDHQSELAGLLQSAAEVEGPDVVVLRDLELVVLVSVDDLVLHLLVLESRLQFDDSHPMPCLP